MNAAFEELRSARIEGHPPPRALEEVAFSPGEPDNWFDVRAHVEGCVRCQADIAHLRQERGVYLATRPPSVFVQAILEREAKSKRPPHRASRAFAVAAVLLAASFVAWALLLPRLDARSSAPTRVASTPVAATPPGPSLVLLVSRGGGEDAPLAAGEALQPGDVLGFQVELPAMGHVLVVGIDAAGRVRRYHPRSGETSVAIPAGVQQLPAQVVSSGRAGDERIFLVHSSEPIPLADVEAALEAAALQGPVLETGRASLPGTFTSVKVRRAAASTSGPESP